MFLNRIFQPRNLCKVKLKFLILPKRTIIDKHLEYLLQTRTRQKSLSMIKNQVQASFLSLEIVGCGGPGRTKGLYVNAAGRSYLFNCGEGVQRLIYENHQKLSRLYDVFITTPVWSNMGGLTGMALTMQKSGLAEFNMHGPDGTTDFLEYVKNYATIKQLSLKKPELEMGDNGNLVFSDCNMIIEYVSMPRKQSERNSDDIESLIIDDTNYYDYQVNRNNKRNLFRVDSLPQKIRKVKYDLSDGRLSNTTSYICTVKPKPGALNIDKCVELGVTPGPILGMLKSGQNVTLENGTYIESSEVCYPSGRSLTFFVIDCYDEMVLEVLVENDSFTKYFESNLANEDDRPYCIVHFTPDNILKDPRYQKWMSKFGGTTQHLILNESNTGLSSFGVHRHQHQLNLIHPGIFPPLGELKDEEPEEVTVPNDCHFEINEATNASPFKIIDGLIKNKDDDKVVQKKTRNLLINRMKNRYRFEIRPQNGLITDDVIKDTPEVHHEEVSSIIGFSESMNILKTNIETVTKSLGTVNEFPKLLMLGTGSSIPSKTRNTSGMLLRIDNDTSIILDCSEGTVGQIFRFYGKEEGYRILSTVKAVYVSHLHVDHHIGFIGLLQERKKVTDDELFLFAPEQILGWLKLYHGKYEEILNDFKLVSNTSFYITFPSIVKEEKDYILKKLKINDLATIFVKHCSFAYGVSITLRDNRKIVYSGDTMPCENLKTLGMDCDLLIHEATHEDEMEIEAKKKRHSTVSQAVEMGNQMNAKFILLTHFSQRYAKLPRITTSGDGFQNVGIAYDNMQIRLDELPLLSLFYPALSIMFNEFSHELEMKAEKRKLRLQRAAEREFEAKN